ncbi:hypothetical protein [Nonomuraea roseoviolacea]|uniref:DUF4367 domain-containing protein n=1 Tax=Nonomuraea roseoviolacea subsp. carminata TaxID=160689 RepID=A0ABT1K4U2_9ACTN|nr:hypothetical protein [Nonomuraea roseoviolacea]MCP2348049.1 hypothetical protein [Nonomuraea roseoviolacea subsp. carminata]
MTTNLDDVVERLAPAPVPAAPLTPLARDLMNEIMDAAPAPAPDARPRRRWRPLVALPVAAALAAAAWIVPSALNSTPAAALDVKEEGGYYVIEVKDLYASPKVYETQLKNLGLNVDLHVVPATPSFEGELTMDTPGWQPMTPFPYRDKIVSIDRPEDCAGVGRTCPIGLKIDKSFTGSADVRLGRAARPGEEYEIIGSLTDVREPMNCVPFYNRPVSEVRAELRKRGVAVDEYAIHKPGQRGEDTQVTTSVPESMYVHGGGLSSYGHATLVVGEEPLADDLVKKLLSNEGCPTS